MTIKNIPYEKTLAYQFPAFVAEWHPTKNGNLTPQQISAHSHYRAWWIRQFDVPDDWPVESIRGKHFDFEWQATVGNRTNGRDCPFLSGRDVWPGFNDLATVNPNLAKEWHPTKNGTLTPSMVTTFSSKNVWWLLPFDVPNDWPVKSLRGKHFDFEWKTSVTNRTQGNECPYLSGQDVWPGFNDLATVNPNLASEWHPTKNGTLTAKDVTAGSGLKYWWLHQFDVPDDYPVESVRGKHFDFIWEETIHSRSKYPGCPFLFGAAAWPGFNDLATVNPNLAKEWHSTKNGDLTPTMVRACSNKKVWWFLPFDVPADWPVESIRGKHFDFEWQATVTNRTRGRDCPFLSGKDVWLGFNDLATVNSDLAKEWHPTKNGTLTPSMVTSCSNKSVWWFLSFDVPDDWPVESIRGKHFDFEWQAVINSRQSGVGCPFLSGTDVWPGFNDLATARPELVAEWHPTKNGKLTPEMVSPYSTQKVWWSLPFDVPADWPVKSLRGKHFDFEWKTSVTNRTQGNECPYLSGQDVWPGFNDLATVNPDLASEWHPTKNGTLTPSMITAGSQQNVWWLYSFRVPDDWSVTSIRGKQFDFVWQATIWVRNSSGGCPFLSSQDVWPGFNDLATVNPRLAAEWHPTKNGTLTPSMVTPFSNQRVWWLLPFDVPDDWPVESIRGKHFDFEWQATVGSRTRGVGCRFLSGKDAWPGFNDLSTVNPDLASEWNYKKNRFTPLRYTNRSNKKVWWKCKNGHEWYSAIAGRSGQGTGCPICAKIQKANGRNL